MRNLARDVLERVIQLAARGDLTIQSLEHGEQIAIEGDLVAGGRADGAYRAHDVLPKLLTAEASSPCTSMKRCAPVMVSIVSTRFCTPESFSAPPAAVAWRNRSIRQPIVAEST